MKQRTEKRRLRLSMETLRMISEAELGDVAGGERQAIDTRPRSNAWSGDYTNSVQNICTY
jgi:hypothetical protein